MEYGRFFHQSQVLEPDLLPGLSVPLRPRRCPRPPSTSAATGTCRGPIDTLLWLSAPVRPLGVSACSVSASIRLPPVRRLHADQARRMAPGSSRCLSARILSRVIPGLCGSMGAIPVYRNPPRGWSPPSGKTVEALKAGMRVIIYPDVDYADRLRPDGRAVRGVPGCWARSTTAPTGKNLSFIPLRTEKRRIFVGVAHVRVRRRESPGCRRPSAWRQAIREALA